MSGHYSQASFSSLSYYSILNLEPTASTVEIQQRYKALSKSFHPDKQVLHRRSTSLDDDSAIDVDDIETFFVAIKTAHDVLTDGVLRMAYDMGGTFAVMVVKRSQQQHAAAAARTKESSAPGEHNEHEHHDLDLYRAMEKATSVDEALFLLQEEMEEFALHQSHHFGGSTNTTPANETQTARDDQTRDNGGNVSRPIQLNTSWQVPYNALTWEREGSNLSVQLRRQATLPTTAAATSSSSTFVSCSASHQVKHDGTSNVSTGMGIDHQSSTTTHWYVDARAAPKLQADRRERRQNKSNNAQKSRYWWWSLQQLSLRTSRQLSSSSFVMLAWAGRPMQPKTWNYSVVSYRNLHLSSLTNLFSPTPTETGTREERQSPKKVQALWRLGLLPTGKLTFAMASLKNLSFPHWRIRFSMGPYPFKVSYQHAENESIAVSYSMGWRNMWSRFKVTWIQTLYRWTINYGVKYDGMVAVPGASNADAVVNGSVWTILCHVHSPDWSIRIPIRLDPSMAVASSSGPSGPIAFIGTILIGQWIDKLLEDWRKRMRAPNRTKEAFSAESQLNGAAPTPDTNSASRLPMPSLWRDNSDSIEWNKVIHQVATKKRQSEALVILRGTLSKCQTASRLAIRKNRTIERNVSDLLQFWVKNGKLELSLQDVFALVRDETKESTNNSGKIEYSSVLSSLFVGIWERLAGSLRRGNSSSRPQQPSDFTITLTIRYRYHGFVYEVAFSDSDLSANNMNGAPQQDILILPNDARATKLGSAEHVS